MQTALRLLDKEAMDRQRALDAALGQIERAFGKGSIMKLGSREAAAEAVGLGSHPPRAQRAFCHPERGEGSACFRLSSGWHSTGLGRQGLRRRSRTSD